jgi:hypothetical protein
MHAPAAFLSSSSFWLPERIVPTAWLEHAPFAFWLIDVLRPRVLVELGTHHGYSYLVFCQAVDRLGLATRCHAVDTWEGDDHAGFYSEDVYEQLRAYHDARYARFSRLIRARFDAASAEFADGSVDLLHIDGRHGYEDVRHDFETWRPKLSRRAVVLFHDTHVFDRGFGVFRLWDELKTRHRHFTFAHCHGLGVLGFGWWLPRRLRALFRSSADAGRGDAIRAAYERLGSAISARVELERRGAQLAQLERVMAAARAPVPADGD